MFLFVIMENRLERKEAIKKSRVRATCIDVWPHFPQGAELTKLHATNLVMGKILPHKKNYTYTSARDNNFHANKIKLVNSMSRGVK